MSDTGSENLNREHAARLTSALTAQSEKLYQLVLETDNEILKATLRNPNLGDEHLQVLLKRRDLHEDIPKLVHKHRKSALSHQLLLALVRNPASPGSLVRSLLPNLRLFELVDLCFHPGVTADQKLAAEQATLRRLPTTPLGSKITLARRATASVVGELLKEGDPRTLAACLNSPRLKEAAVFQFLNSPAATATTLSMVARHNRWSQRPNLRLAILTNRQSPQIWYTLWLPKLPIATVNQLFAGQRLSQQQKGLVREELIRRGLRK